LTMGMYGSIVVRARGGAPQAWTKGPAYDREYTMLLSEADPSWNSAVEHGAAFNRTSYNPTYFFINGRSFPDTMNDPADMIHGKKGDRVLVRLINAGYTWKSMHMHGFHFDVIASDGRPLPQPESKDTISIGPGERYDLLVTLDQTGTYPFHSHAIVDNLNSGLYPGGIHTMVQVDDGNSPAPVNHADHGAAVALPGDLSTVSYLKAGEVRAHVHGTPLVLMARPIVVNGVLLAPADFVAQALGAQLTLDLSAETATFQRAQQRVQMTAQHGSAVTEKGELPVPVAARQAGQTMLVPVQPLADYFGLKAAFTADAGELLIGPAAADAVKASRSLLQPPDLAAPKPAAVPAAPAVAPAPPAPAPAQPKQDPPPVTGAAAGPTMNVVIHSLMFDPPELQVKAGTTVAWLNADSLAHAVATPTNAFGDGHIDPGHKYEYTFQEPGTYDYYCSIHPEMKGTIVVTK
ncbi:MAG: hypothetical protein JWN15_3823, partial [Firmicutes bacterium]|nr:hypothetical protein [Bacillota bacterium]